MGATNILNQEISLGKAQKALRDDPTSAEHLSRANQVLENNLNSFRNHVQIYQETMQRVLYKLDFYPFPLPLWGDGSAFHVNVCLYGFGQYGLLPNSVYFGSNFSLIFMPLWCY